MTQAPAVTEARREPARWVGFDALGDVPYRPLCPNQIVWREMVIYRNPGGTTAVRNNWIPPATYMIEVVKNQVERSYSYFDALYAIGDDMVMMVEAKYKPPTGRFQVEQAPVEVEPELPESALAAREVRELSGLSAGRLGDVFPVHREIFQRWTSGKPPSAANLERLLALRHFLRALAERVADPNSWLLSPLDEGAASPTAYEVLKTGNLRALWNAIVDLPSTAKRYTREIPGEGAVTVVEGSLRGRDYPTTEEELDDYAELFDET